MEHIYTGKTVDEAIAKGLAENKWSRNDVQVHIIDAGKSGIFHRRKARVQLTLKSDAYQSAEVDNEYDSERSNEGDSERSKEDEVRQSILNLKVDRSALQEADTARFAEHDGAQQSEQQAHQQSKSKSNKEQGDVYWDGHILQIARSVFDNNVTLIPPQKTKLFKDDVPLSKPTIIQADDQIVNEANRNHIDSWLTVKTDQHKVIATIRLNEDVAYECIPQVRRTKGEVTISFGEHKRESLPFSGQDIYKFASDKGIKIGFDFPAIEMWLQEEDKTKPFVIARGQNKKDGRDTVFKKLYQVKETSDQDPDQDEESNVNWFELQDIESVQAGEKLVEIIPPVQGENGMNLYGEPLIAKHGKDIQLEVGEGTVLSEDGRYALATIDGKPHLHKRKLRVSPVHVVKGDLTLKEGSIKFNGDVLVSGNVAEGLSIEATGNITVKGSVTHGKLVAGQHVTVERSLIGSQVTAGGHSPFYQMVQESIETIHRHLTFIEQAYKQLEASTNLNSQGINTGVGRIIKLLIENKMPTLSGDLKKIKTSFEQHPGETADPEITSWVEMVIRKLTGGGPLSIHSMDELKEIRYHGNQLLQMTKEHTEQTAHVYARYVHYAHVRASGDIYVQGSGVYISHLLSGRDIHVSGSRGIVRGGSLEAGRTITVKELGGPSNAKTTAHVKSPQGKVQAQFVHSSVQVNVYKANMTVEKEERQVEFKYDPDHHGIKMGVFKAKSAEK